jgi:hypothetical protein
MACPLMSQQQGMSSCQPWCLQIATMLQMCTPSPRQIAVMACAAAAIQSALHTLN